MSSSVVAEEVMETISDEAGESAHVAHHFASPTQQFAAGKLGIWLFLITEVLFFSGLFVAYAVYRSTHPEVFVYAHQFLDKSLGALNTVVLICSSLSMAWGVRCAQLGQRKALIACLAITLACASFFLGVKAVEYSHKWDAGLLWGARYGAAASTASVHVADATAAHAAAEHASAEHGWTPLEVLSLPAWTAIGLSGLLAVWGALAGNAVRRGAGLCLVLIAAAFFVGVGSGQMLPTLLGSGSSHHDHGTASETITTADGQVVPVSPRLIGIFFSIYYVMTGLHAIHILAGMGVMVWLLFGAFQGRYGPWTYAPVDFVGLYWHLVDLVWIYLFPLLYLIH